MIIAFPVIPDYRNRDVLYQKYVLERLSIAEIAREFASSETSVLKYLRRYDIETRPASAKNRNRLAYGEAWRGRKVAAHQRELENVIKMQSLRAQGFSYWKVADILNSMKVPTKTRRGKWHARSVQQILDRIDGQRMETSQPGG